ncbi:MAG: Mu-like prophage major head subunit gpT family protein [Rickettsiales bacterium]|nr:Mu-like prophage major head subunit gpT family protein [Rickettsiales bacterium]
MLKGYSEAEENFEKFTSRGNLADFKTAERVNMSEFGSLDPLPEGGEYKYGTIGEGKENIKLATYGKMFSITRQAIINDDIDAFTKIPRKMGAAAKRKVADLVWSILTSNPLMADGKALFHADHKNLAASGAAISATALSLARRAMRLQRDISGEALLNISPYYLIVPVSKEDDARLLMTSETDYTQANPKKPNIMKGAFEVISDPRLDAASATAWFLTANPQIFDVIEVAYLDGNSEPYLEEKEGWNVDGVEFKVRIDAAAKAMEYRTVYKNPGA